jgi:hypothetical protein
MYTIPFAAAGASRKPLVVVVVVVVHTMEPVVALNAYTLTVADPLFGDTEPANDDAQTP